MSDAEIFGNFGKDRNAMFVESINMILKIWESSPPYNIKGNFWDISVSALDGLILKYAFAMSSALVDLDLMDACTHLTYSAVGMEPAWPCFPQKSDFKRSRLSRISEP